MTSLSKYILLFNALVVVAAAVYGVAVYRELTKELRAFSYFLFLSGFIQLVSTVLWLMNINNMPLLHLYVAGGFFFLAMFYLQVLNGFIDRKIIVGITLVFLVFTILNSIFIQNIFTFNSYALTVESVLIVILSISTYMLMLEDIVKKSRVGVARSLNWINSGLFIYYASSLIIFHFANLFFLDLSFQIFSKSFNVQTWMLHSFFSDVMYVCFCIGLWWRPRADSLMKHSNTSSAIHRNKG